MAEHGTRSTGGTDGVVLRLVLVGFAILLVAPMLMMVFAMPVMGGMGWGPFQDGGRQGLLAWALLWVAFVAVLLLATGLLVRGLSRAGVVGGDDPAMAELRMAYARGDLSEEEFERRREQLESTE